jgi:hypothetical protein
VYTPDETQAAESDIAVLLEHRYGDGIVYLPKGGPKELYARAVKQGFISEDGYLTRKGRALLARCRYP